MHRRKDENAGSGPRVTAFVMGRGYQAFVTSLLIADLPVSLSKAKLSAQARGAWRLKHLLCPTSCLLSCLPSCLLVPPTDYLYCKQVHQPHNDDSTGNEKCSHAYVVTNMCWSKFSPMSPTLGSFFGVFVPAFHGYNHSLHARATTGKGQ